MTEKPERSIEDLATLVRLHLKTLELNGEKTCEVLKKAAADAIAEYEVAKAKQDQQNG